MDGIDPRLRGSEQPSTSQSQVYSSALPTQYPQPPIKLPPPSPHQQQHHQQPIQHQLQHANSGFRPWPQDGGPPYHQQPPNPPSSSTFSRYGATSAPNSIRQGGEESKRPRACEACRGLKVRCEFDGDPRDCKRCIKAGRPCQVTAPSRKRQKKTDTKVAELEKKLEDLRSELVAKGNLPLHTNAPEYGYDGRNDERSSVPDMNTTVGASQVLVAEDQRRYHSIPEESRGGPIQRQFPYEPGTALSPRKRQNSSPAEEVILPPTQNQTQRITAETDHLRTHPFYLAQTAFAEIDGTTIPDQANPEMISWELLEPWLPDRTAQFAAFYRYVNHVSPHTPFVVLGLGTNPDHLRLTQPILYATIVATMYQGLTKARYITWIKKVIAHQSMILGNSSIELIQAMLVMSLFCWDEEHTTTNIFVNAALTMSSNMGIGSLGNDGPRDQNWSQWALENSHLPNSELVEAARANIGCFVASKNVGKRPHELAHGGFMHKVYLQILETSKGALASDKLLCHWLRLELLADRFRWNLLDGDVSELLPGVLKEMEDCKASMTADNVPNSSMIVYYAIDLFIHELAASKLAAAGGNDYTDDRLGSIHGLLECFLKLTSDEIANLPGFQFTYVAYALFAMFERCKTKSIKELGLPLYTDGVLTLLRESDRKGDHAALHWHLILIATLREWAEKSATEMQDLEATASMIRTPKQATNAFYTVVGNGVEYTWFEKRQGFFKLLEEVAAKKTV